MKLKSDKHYIKSKPQSWFFENTNNADRCLTKLIKIKMKNQQTSKIVIGSRGIWEGVGVRIRCGKRQERGPEGQKNEWKSVSGRGWVGGCEEYPRNLGWGRIP